MAKRRKSRAEIEAIELCSIVSDLLRVRHADWDSYDIDWLLSNAQRPPDFEYTDKQWKEIGGAWDKELARLVKEKSAVDAQLTELNRIFALSMKEKQAEAILHRTGSEDGTRAPISPVVPRPAIPEPPTLNPPSRVEHIAPRSPAPNPATSTSRTPFDEFPVLRPGTGTASPPSTAAVATPPSVPKTGGTQDPRSEQHKTLKCPECGAANYPTEWYCERCGGELATM